MYCVSTVYGMSIVRSKILHPIVVGVVGGILYSAIMLSWMFSRGVYFSTGDLATVVTGLGYSVGGLFLMAAVPLFLFTRYSLILPAVTTIWFLGNTVYQELYGAHLHPLTSYLTVWPFLFGMAVGTGLVEVLIRVVTGRKFGRGRLRPLV